MPDRRRAKQPQPPSAHSLAWELAAVARPHLTAVQADRIYIAIGIGEMFEAIDMLITLIARNRVVLSEGELSRLSNWLDSYRGQSDEPRLRQLISALQTIGARRCSPAPKAPGAVV